MQDYSAAREAMVDRQVRPSDVTRRGIVEAMLWAPREAFVPASAKPVAYAGEAVSVGNGRWLMDPRVFAKMLDTAEIDPHESVLDIGCGLGYSSAVLSRICRGVVAVEDSAQTVEAAERALSALEVDNVAVVEGPLAEGVPKSGPYDVIIVEGGIARDPDALYEQLAEGGRLVALWMDGVHGQVRVAVKSGGKISTRWVFDATAPLLPGFDAKPAFAF